MYKVWLQQGFGPLYGPLRGCHNLSGHLSPRPRVQRRHFVACSAIDPWAGLWHHLAALHPSLCIIVLCNGPWAGRCNTSRSELALPWILVIDLPFVSVASHILEFVLILGLFMGCGRALLFLVCILIFDFVSVIDIASVETFFVHHDACYAAEGLEEKTSSRPTSVVLAPYGSQEALLCGTEQDLCSSTGSSLERLQFPCQDQVSNGRMYTLEMSGLQTVEETVCGTLPCVQSTMADCHRSELCTQSRSPTARDLCAAMAGSTARMDVSDRTIRVEPTEIEEQEAFSKCQLAEENRKRPTGTYVSYPTTKQGAGERTATAIATAFNAMARVWNVKHINAINDDDASALVSIDAHADDATCGAYIPPPQQIGQAAPVAPTFSMPPPPQAALDPEQKELIDLMRARQMELPPDLRQKVQKIVKKEGARATKDLHSAVRNLGAARAELEEALQARSNLIASWKSF